MLDTVLAAIWQHHGAAGQLRAWATDHLSSFGPRELDELEGLAEQLAGPGTFLSKRMQSAELEPEQVAHNLFAPGDVRVQLLLLELLELISSRQSDSVRQLRVLQRWSGRLAELGILDDAHDRCQDALALIRERGLGETHEIDMRQYLAMIYQQAVLPRRAIAEFERILAFDEQAQDQLGIARSTGNLAGAWSAAADHEQALTLHQVAIRLFMHCTEDPWLMVPALRSVAVEFLNAGLTLERLHRIPDALEYLEHSISTMRGLDSSDPGGFARELTAALLASARCTRQLGFPDRAQAAAAEAAGLAAQAGLRDLFEQARHLQQAES
jgi:tetratricopeptide (TPR) repeat protein